MLEFLRQQLKEMLTKRAALASAMTGVLDKPKAESRGLTEEENAEFGKATEALKAHDDKISEVRGQIEAAEAAEKRATANNELAARLGQTGTEAPARPSVRVLSEPMVYGRGSKHSYFLDMARAELGRGDGDGGVQAARERLARHGKELDIELPSRERRREERAREDLGRIDGMSQRARESAFERETRVNPNRTDGQGGYAVPPLWLIDQYIDLPRFGRVIANSVLNMTLPTGTDSINIPKLATGTATAVQTADAAAVQSTDMTDTTVNAPVRTIAGQQDVAMQLLDQSPISFDEVLYNDLIGDYNQKLDVQVISGSGSNGQCTGILNVASINAITYTDSSPTLPELWVPLLKSASKVATGRKLPATAVFMTPAMWYWALSQLDTTNRPLIVPADAGPFNPMMLQTGVGDDGYMGRFTYGLPCLTDGNIPSNLGSGTDETRIITARTSDLFLWEGSLKTRALSEVLSGTLQVRFQVWNYFAFMGNRRPESISAISGTGTIPTSGF